jgi:hypothetical protein
MSDAIAKTQLSQLPHWVQARIKELEIADAGNWISRPIPALDNRSVLETIHAPNGEQALRDYFQKVIGRFR